MKQIASWSVVSILCAATAAGSATRSPVAVSPGDSSKLAVVEARCPTFSWGAVDGAEGYEVVLYLVGKESVEAKPVLSQRISGSALGWTPSLDRCLERGSQYAWSVRAVGRRGATEWSVPSLFEVASGPSDVEFEEALQVIRQYLVTQGKGGEGAVEIGVEIEPQSMRKAAAPVPRAAAATQLSVDGGVVATSFTGDFKFNTTKTGYQHISALTLIGDAIVRQTGSGRAYLRVGESQAWVEAPLHLPDGVVVTELVCRFLDNDSNGRIQMTLMRHGIASETQMASVFSTNAFASATHQIEQELVISDATVDNASFAYYLLVYLTGVGGSANVSINRCRVAYTYDEARF